MPANSVIQLRRGTAAQWTSANPVLASGEPGYETDTGKEKRGDGTTVWASLPYVGGQDFYAESFRQSGDADDTLRLSRAIAAASTAGGGRVIAKARKTYQVSIQSTVTVLNPSGSSGSRSYCLMLPTGVILDMQGSTLQLQGSTEATIVTNTNVTGTGRTTDFGLVNAVLDGRNITFTTHSLMQIGYFDRLTLRNVKMVNGVFQGGWLYDGTTSKFDQLDCDGFQGQPWTIGAPQATGLGHNQVYDSSFGKLLGKNVTLLNTGSQPGNPYNFVLTRCDIDTINVRNCSGGVKLQQPSQDVTIGEAIVDTCGEATALNSGFKLQGDPTYPTGTDRPTRIKVGSVIATNQANVGLYMYHTQDCTIESYSGYNNVLLHTANADVYIAGGINDRVGSISSRNSGGGGVRVTNDLGSAGPSGYRISNVKVIDPGQQSGSSIKNGVRVDYASSGSFGRVEVVDDQGSPTMDIGFNVTAAGAAGSVDYYSSSGQTGASFVGQTGFSTPSVGADVQTFTASGTWTKPSWATTVAVFLVGPGGGGGAGARSVTNTARVGGGGGGGGAYTERLFAASSLPSTVSVTIGSVGTGAAGQTTDSTAGANGTAGGTSQFSSYLRAGGGSGGTGGGISGTGGTAGNGGTGLFGGSNGGGAATTGGAGVAGSTGAGPGGGGSGGGLSTGNVEVVGGAGSPMTSIGLTSGTAGAVTGGAGGAGPASTATSQATPGGGAGGGGSSNTTAGGNGGAGGNYGGGGGGGGATLNGNTSGAGGNGAGGICVVISR